MTNRVSYDRATVSTEKSICGRYRDQGLLMGASIQGEWYESVQHIARQTFQGSAPVVCVFTGAFQPCERPFFP